MSLELLLTTRLIEKKSPVGQFMIASGVTNIDWVVPDGVYSICAVVIGTGGYGLVIGAVRQVGGGGGLSWRNNIPVTPGETLSLRRSNSNSAIYRDNSILVIAEARGLGGYIGALGGKNAHPINDGGGNGGNGNINGGGGGAGGYSGNGGDGGLEYSVFGKAGSGGGGGGGAYRIQTTSSNYSGGGVSPYGEGVSGNEATNGNGFQGSTPDGSQTRNHLYGGGRLGPTYNNCIRIIWGEGRFFPNTNTQDM